MFVDTCFRTAKIRKVSDIKENEKEIFISFYIHSLFSSFSLFGLALCRHLPVAGLAVADTAEEVQALLFVHILDCCTCRHSSPSA